MRRLRSVETNTSWSGYLKCGCNHFIALRQLLVIRGQETSNSWVRAVAGGTLPTAGY
ncbi:hypothetical protein [Flavobacterium acetivorans]|uniref:hypothetical protein n=1 Tax=Flavobacterium acetivorans TaxID=2893883 RepID=UPI001E61AC80|nr:hypothetical protein [Flavobacterium sp. F-29]UFH35084.1 hypothetical protein LNP19_13485 [Flavobacterium sp. F-29]